MKFEAEVMAIEYHEIQNKGIVGKVNINGKSEYQ